MLQPLGLRIFFPRRFHGVEIRGGLLHEQVPDSRLQRASARVRTDRFADGWHASRIHCFTLRGNDPEELRQSPCARVRCSLSHSSLFPASLFRRNDRQKLRRLVHMDVLLSWPSSADDAGQAISSFTTVPTRLSSDFAWVLTWVRSAQSLSAPTFLSARKKPLGGLLTTSPVHTASAGDVSLAPVEHGPYAQATSIKRADRERLNGHRGKVVWFTGLSGAGKSTIADALEAALHAQGRHTYLLDGDPLRQGLNRDLGFSAADRAENTRRAAEVAKLMTDAGLIVMAAFISPFRREREVARELIGPERFFEVFVDTPLATCERRDPKGLYRKARQGLIRNMTGIDSPYEAPEHPQLAVTPGEPVDQVVRRLVAMLEGADR